MPFSLLRTLYLICCLQLTNPVLMAQLPRLALRTAPPGDAITIVAMSSDDRLLLTTDQHYHYLWDLETGVLVKTFSGVDDPIFTSAGKIQMKVRHADNLLKLFDYNSGEETELNFDSSELSKIELSKDLKKGIGISKNNPTSLSLFTFPNRKQVKQLIGHHTKILKIGFSDDGKRAFSISSDSTLIVWDAVKGYLINRIKCGTNYILNYRFNKGNDLLFIQEFARELGYSYSLWHIKSGRFLQNLTGENTIKSELCVSRDKKYIAIESKKGFVSVISFKTGKIIRKIYCGEYSRPLQFNLDGSKIFTCSFREIKYWEIRSGELLDTINSHAFAFILNSKENKAIFTTSTRADGPSIIVWDLEQNKLANNFGHAIRDEGSNSLFRNNDSLIMINRNNGSLNVLDLTNNKVIVSIKDGLENIAQYKVSPKKNWIATWSSSGWAVWNLRTGEKQWGYKEFSKSPDAWFSPDEKLFAIHVDKDSTIKVFNRDSGTLLQSFSPGFWFYGSLIDNTSSKILTGDISNFYKVWDLSTGDLIFSMEQSKKNSSFFTNAMFTPDGNYLVFPQDGRHISLYSFKKKSIEYTVEGELFANNTGSISQDGERIAIRSKNQVKILITNSGAVVDSLMDSNMYTYSAQFIHNDEQVITTSVDNVIRIWNLYPKELIKKIPLDQHFSSRDFDSKENELIASVNEEVAFVDLNTGKKKFSVLARKNPPGNFDHIVIDGEGYYRCNPEVAKLLHYVTKDLKVISFEQLDAKYNRPDKVMQALGSRDSTLIKSYKLAYQKRIEKLGIDTTAFDEKYNVPEADFVDRGTIKTVQVQEEIKLRIKGNDKVRKLDQFNVWVNQVPVYGLKGISLRRSNSKELDTTIVVQLSAGENRIETSIRNDNGIESYRIPRTVTYNPAVKPKEKVYFVGIGIDKFSDHSRNLMYSSKDIIVLAEKMKKKYGDDIVIDTLINTSVNIENVKALKTRLLKTTVNDKVIVAYSGHGLLDSINNYYLSTYSVDFGKPERGGLPYDELENILDGIPARKKLLLLDACHSGEVDRKAKENENQPILIAAIPDVTQLPPKGGADRKGVSAQDNPNKNKIGLNDSFDLMQTLFVNVGKNTGTTVFAAAAGSQAAFEKNDLQHSVFSYYIIQAFDQNAKSLKLSELKKSITENVMKESNQKQIPTFRSETIAYDWALW